MQSLESLNQKIIQCERCLRLSSYIREVAKNKVKRFKAHQYLGKPLPGFGDFKATLLIVGLAPAAHVGNRTGRIFTDDSSGDWLARALYENGFATKPTSQSLNDGFELINAYVTAVVRCVLPKNKPLREELENCSNYLTTEISLLKNVRIIICLGRIAFDSCCKILNIKGKKFVHGKSF